MTDTKEKVESTKRPRQKTILRWVLVLMILAGFGGVTWLISVARRASLSLPAVNTTTISQSLVVEKVQKVAKLVSTETTLRDVVIYENTWFGSTKRSLVVVTGKVLAGINLETGSAVQIDETTKHITITLPPPGILAVEITELKTYDEQRGLWNSFAATDRDAIFQVARDQLQKTSQELKITDTAKESARELLQDMFSANGYSVEIVYK